MPDDPTPPGQHYDFRPHDPRTVDGPRDPRHDQATPVAPVPTDEPALRAWLASARRKYRDPGQYLPEYGAIVEHLAAIDAARNRTEEGDDEDTVDYPAPTDPALHGLCEMLTKGKLSRLEDKWIRVAIQRIAELTTQRDELLKACQEVKRWIECDTMVDLGELSDDCKEVLGVVRAAIMRTTATPSEPTAAERREMS